MITSLQPRIKSHWAPCGKRENVQDYYTIRVCPAEQSDYWEPKVDPDGKVRDRLSYAERQQFLDDNAYLVKAINERSPQTVLDFGCGPGWLLSALAAPRKLGIEPSARAESVAAGIELRDDIANIGSEFCDVVICHHVIEHLADPLYYLDHLRRVLKRGGLLVLATPDFASPCAKRFGAKYRMLCDATHISLFTLESCSRMLRDKAFKILDVVFPFPDRYAIPETMERWRDTSQVSPPWPGNWMTFFAVR